MSAYPHLTDYIRAHGNVTEFGPDVYFEVDLKKRRPNDLRRKTKRFKVTWEELCDIIENNPVNGGVRSTIDMLLKDLKKYSRELDPNYTAKLVEVACVYLFFFFQNADEITSQHMSDLRKLFGNVVQSSVVKVFEVVKRLTRCITDTIVQTLIMASQEKRIKFGRKIRCLPLTMPGQWNSENLNWLQNDDQKTEFNLVYRLPTHTTEVKPVDVHTKKHGTAWLNLFLQTHYSQSENVDDLILTTTRLLLTSRTNEELQNDLCELLGFDRLEIIESLLHHRKEFLALSTKESESYLLKAEALRLEKKPALGASVIIQTDQEKEMLKLLRKGERRIKRHKEHDDEGVVLDAEYLKRQREYVLMSAVNSPLFRGDSQERSLITYPHVYDSYLQARQSASYIVGQRMVLPNGFERKNTREYEEVSIPPSEAPPTNVGKILKPISELDEIGRSCFQGMKTLNRIQSVVFDVAYHSNENLLICAPTGAGKTNIAMLTIVHEIKQHLENGIIRKENFKIIYVAPMKALAAEMVTNFSSRLKSLGIAVRELTGDMQLTKNEIMHTQIIVTTPEKWDVITRKGTGDVGLTQLVRLLIFDEVHLLHGDRGPVIEALVARTLRQVESSQSMIRIVGLSATLPNYLDVAEFLHVNTSLGLYYFDNRFRPVPLSQTFVGVKAVNPLQQMQEMDNVCYDKVSHMVDKGHQVMVFVHARNATYRTALALREMARTRGHTHIFESKDNGLALKQAMHTRNKQLEELLPTGFSIHHAGMIRPDRNLVEKLFREGYIKVLVCTSTLAWGVNLPAHAVIIKGTEIYDAKHGSFVDLSFLDVLQIFGRAGRPQYDSSGHGTIITTHDKLAHYLSLLTRQYPIESQFEQNLTDNLNAEIVLGTVSNVEEAVQWLAYTYLFIRMQRNPLVYGIKYQMVKEDPMLVEYRNELIDKTARKLDKIQMIRYDKSNGELNATDLGRTASYFYIKYNTVEVINDSLAIPEPREKPGYDARNDAEPQIGEAILNDGEVLALVSMSEEFQQLKVREDEMDELEQHIVEDCCLPALGGKENSHGKVNILLQSHISRATYNSFSLISDKNYVTQNGIRILRSLFEIVLRRHWPIMTNRLLRLCKMLEQQVWPHVESPLSQFANLNPELLSKIESLELTLEQLQEMDAKEIGHFLNHPKMGPVVKRFVNYIPNLSVDATVHPITTGILRVRALITPDFRWDDNIHGNMSESFWVWVEDPKSDTMHHYEYFVITKRQVIRKEVQELVFTIPLTGTETERPNQYIIRIVSDRWLGSETSCALSFQHLILPEHDSPNTELLDLDPLPVTALNDPELERLYKFTHFNPIQTQIFHTLYHTDSNVLIGAPTGSGKTIAAEIAIFRVFREYPGTKVVFIAPLKALVRERMIDWKVRLEKKLKKQVIEMTGDITPDIKAIGLADVIVTTPEKWDGVSRSWQTRNYVKSVSLIVIDEIHLLGEDRGPVLEVIVSRTNFISSHSDYPLRIIGLSTALANAHDLSGWLGIQEVGLFNFRPSVRPVPIDVHIKGFSGKHYCPRMASMNKPALSAIKQYSPDNPTLIFVASRRQTRVTALDLIACLAAENNPKQWLNMPDMEMDKILVNVKDINLKLTLAFGIGIHHAGLQDKDRKVVEELFVSQKIQVLIATATLAWGVNFPAHLVIIKGTEYYDGKTKRYVDFPVTDVLQMMGRAGRPQFDDKGVAVVFVHDIKKNFYKKFLYSPFPVESSLLKVLPDHLNAEIVSGAITSKQNCLDYLTWTYFFRRLLQNPNYYELEDKSHDVINKYLSKIVEKALHELEQSTCISIEEDGRTIHATTSGRLASFYYLNHSTLRHFQEKMRPDMTTEQLLGVLCNAHEYQELPVRHNEDSINTDLAKSCPLPVSQFTMDSPHTKANLLFQVHFSRLNVPCTDYLTDLKSVLDQAIRILQAMLDVAADQGWLGTAIGVANMIQMVLQGRWIWDNSILILPHLEQHNLHCFKTKLATRQRSVNSMPADCLPALVHACANNYETLAALLRRELDENQIDQIYQTLKQLPQMCISLAINGWWEGEEEKSSRGICIQNTRQKSVEWIPLHADQEYWINITMQNITRKHDSRAHAPRFPKPKDEGWFLILGDIENKELLALKRVGFISKRTTFQLAFFTPPKQGRCVYTLYILSDSYIGLDQQYDLHLDVTPVSVEAQFNTEVPFDE